MDEKNNKDRDRDLSQVKPKSSNEITDDESINEGTLICSVERLCCFIVPANKQQGVMKNIFQTMKNNPTFNKDLSQKPAKTLENQTGTKTFTLGTLWKTCTEVRDLTPALRGMRKENNICIVGSPLSQ